MSDNDNKVEFRLPSAFLEQLDDLLAKYNETHAPTPQLKRSAFARKVFIEALPRETATEELQVMNTQLRNLRKEVATTVAVMLVEFRNMDPKKAHDWVSQRFLKG